MGLGFSNLETTGTEVGSRPCTEDINEEAEVEILECSGIALSRERGLDRQEVRLMAGFGSTIGDSLR